jgi:hypothetical protein
LSCLFSHFERLHCEKDLTPVYCTVLCCAVLCCEYCPAMSYLLISRTLLILFACQPRPFNFVPVPSSAIASSLSLSLTPDPPCPISSPFPGPYSSPLAFRTPAALFPLSGPGRTGRNLDLKPPQQPHGLRSRTHEIF